MSRNIIQTAGVSVFVSLWIIAQSGAVGAPVPAVGTGVRSVESWNARLGLFEPPPTFAELIRARMLLDAYASRYHVAEEEGPAATLRPAARHRAYPRVVRVVRAELPETVLSYRLGFGRAMVPLASFRAPILERVGDRPATLQPAEPSAMAPDIPSADLAGDVSETERCRRAAGVLQRSLASDGLLLALARTLEVLGPARFLTNGPGSLESLRTLGLPVDLLPYFRLGPAAEPESIVRELCRRLVQAGRIETLQPTLRAAPFVFRKSHPEYRAAEENGLHEVGLARLQIGGGYQNGIVPGSSVDVTGQLIEALPASDFLVSVPDEFLENIRWMAVNAWALRRSNALTLVPEPLPLSAWAQDNGKAGYLAGDGPRFGTPATLLPRYASQDELQASFVPGDSFLADGLRAAGHTVIHSPLLFQGGNLLVVGEPSRGRRLLLISETEIQRNRNLGLTPSQVLEAFRIEFGVDRCVEVPAVSYHLDYDVTVRVVNGEVLAFVNHGGAAARLIVQRAVETFERAGVISAAAASAARADLAAGENAALARRLAAALKLFVNERGQYRTNLVALFASASTDAAALNLRRFLAAVDWLVGAGTSTDASDAGTRAYFSALRKIDARARTQREVLRKLGWKVLPIPSLPDLFQSVNYVNGLHDRTRYLMPALGGFYTPVDDAAARAFQAAFGTNATVVRVFTSELQRQHGAVHCVASVYPRLAPEDGSWRP